jgi:8-oxo-dGTP diphosphatase
VEVWDVLDANGVKTGKTAIRGIPMLPGEFHLVVDVWVKNLNGKYLISKRASTKPSPGMWETTGGSALTGEDGLAAAIREVKEEVGIDLTPGAGKFICRQVRTTSITAYFLDIWQFNEPILDVEPTCQLEEVSEAKWASKTEILELIGRGLFINHMDPGLDDIE